MQRLLLTVAVVLVSCATMPDSERGQGKMTRPKRISGSFDELYRQGNHLRYHGKLIVKCSVTVEGTVENCRVIRPIRPSELDTKLAQMLQDWRYEPATFDGAPIEVDYVFNLNFVAPPADFQPPRR